MEPNDKEKREIDNPGLNQDSAYNPDETFEETDDFHKYDDTDGPVENADKDGNNPNFNRTYDKNAPEDVDNAGRFDGNIPI